MGQTNSENQVQYNAINALLNKTDVSLEETKALLADIASGLASAQLDLNVPSEIPPKKQDIEKACRGIGHDFNGILANIRGLVEITQMMEPNAPENVQNTFTKILTLVDRGHHATELVRMYGKVMSCDKKKLKLHQSLRRVLNDIKMILELDSSIAFTCPEEVSIEFDETQFETLLTQLCKNAIQAIKAKGTEPELFVDVSLINNSDIQLAVKDNGKGIAADIGDRVYDPFYSTKKATEGLGLGLSIARQIVMNHDGHIHYSSDVDTGSTFTCQLPVVV